MQGGQAGSAAGMGRQDCVFRCLWMPGVPAPPSCPPLIPCPAWKQCWNGLPACAMAYLPVLCLVRLCHDLSAFTMPPLLVVSQHVPCSSPRTEPFPSEPRVTALPVQLPCSQLVSPATSNPWDPSQLLTLARDMQWGYRGAAWPFTPLRDRYSAVTCPWSHRFPFPSLQFHNRPFANGAVREQEPVAPRKQRPVPRAEPDERTGPGRERPRRGTGQPGAGCPGKERGSSVQGTSSPGAQHHSGGDTGAGRAVMQGTAPRRQQWGPGADVSSPTLEGEVRVRYPLQ